MSEAIACHVRLRPACPSDGRINAEAIKIEGSTISALNVTGDKRYSFELDRCHDVDSTQEDVFEHVRPLLEQAYRGISTTIFAYGVTGAGKTHTMQGNKSDPGVIPRTVEAIFQKRSELRSSTLRVSFSYVEILKDEVYDLLGDRTMPRKRDIRMSMDGHNVIADLVLQPINALHEFAEIYEAAAKTRKTASTKLNSSSSRSHAILTLHLEITDDTNPAHATTSKICLTDLAGSENNNLTGNDRERMRESAAINTSLTTLGKVVDALNLNAQKASEGGTFVPYRESKLTRLLQDALGGTSQGLLICCLAPGERFARDTINTLQFAKKSKNVENRITVNTSYNASRRLSAPLHAKSVDPTKSFKVHPAGDISAQSRVIKGRMALGTISANARPVRPVVAAKGKDACGKGEKENVGVSLGLTEEQLDQKIQKIVSHEMALGLVKQGVTDPTAELFRSTSTLPEVATEKESHVEKQVTSVDSMTAEEREARARVIVSQARRAHQSGDLEQALCLYKKAYEHVPENHRLARRITEIQLSLEGILPLTSKAQPMGGIKRSRASGSLAELSGSGDLASPAKRGRVDESGAGSG